MADVRATSANGKGERNRSGSGCHWTDSTIVSRTAAKTPVAALSRAPVVGLTGAARPAASPPREQEERRARPRRQEARRAEGDGTRGRQQAREQADPRLRDRAVVHGERCGGHGLVLPK